MDNLWTFHSDKITRAKNEWELAVDAFESIVLLVDEEGKIIRGNKGVEQWGLDKVNKINGKHFHSLFHPKCSLKNCYLVSKWNKCKCDKSAKTHFNIKKFDKILGKFLSINFIIPSSVKNGKNNYSIHSVIKIDDITSEKKSEERIEQLLSELQAVVNSLPYSYIKINNKGRLLNVSGKKQPDKFFINDSHIGKKIHEIFSPKVNLKYNKALESVRNGKKIEEFEYTISSSLGRQFMEAKMIPVSDNTILVLNKNQTEFKKLLSIANTIDKMKNLGVVFSGIRHEIGNPINTIKMTMNVLKRNYSDFSDEKKFEYIDRVIDETTRVEFLLKNLRNFNIYENLICKKTDLHEFIENFINHVREDFQNKGVTIKKNFFNEKLYISSDTRALHQVMLNLMTNSLEAMKSTRIPEITVSTTGTKSMVSLIVKDNGEGITSENKKNVFEPFFTTKAYGTGLGLSIVQKIVFQMGGTLDIDNKSDTGISVIINFPREKN